MPKASMYVLGEKSGTVLRREPAQEFAQRSCCRGQEAKEGLSHIQLAATTAGVRSVMFYFALVETGGVFVKAIRESSDVRYYPTVYYPPWQTYSRT